MQKLWSPMSGSVRESNEATNTINKHKICICTLHHRPPDNRCVRVMSCSVQEFGIRNNSLEWYGIGFQNKAIQKRFLSLSWSKTVRISHYRFEVRHMTGPRNEQALLLQTSATHLCFYFNLGMHECHISCCLYAKERECMKKEDWMLCNHL